LPEKSTGACAAIVYNKLYLFGGYVQFKGQTNRLSVMDLSTFIWRDLSNECSGQIPSPRDKLGCWVDGRKIIYFGGFGQPPENMNRVRGDFSFESFPHAYESGIGWNNQLYVFNSSSRKWSQPKSTGSVPCPRAAFATAQISNKCFLFGGRYKDQRRNDLYVLDSKTFFWKLIEIPGEGPCGRSWHAMETISNNHLFVYGGFDNTDHTLKDTWIFDIQESVWSELENSTKHLDIFAPRMWHTACKTDSPGEVVIFGGCIDSIIGIDHSKHTNTVATFRFSPLSLKRQCLDFIMANIGRYSNSVLNLPQSLQRNIHHRSVALGLRSPNGHGKLVSNCQVM